MKHFLWAIVIMASLTACIGPGVNSDIIPGEKQTFPKLTGIDLKGEEQTLPQHFTGKANLVLIGFEREHQETINTWLEPAEKLAQIHSDMRYYEVPVIYELNPAARFWINNGMRGGIPDAQARARTITVYTDRKVFAEHLQMEMDTVYALLLAPEGKIVWRSNGEATEEKIVALEQEIQQLLK